MQLNTKLTFKIFLKYFLKYKWRGFLIIGSVIIGSALNLVTPIFYKNFFDILTSTLPKSEIISGLVNTIVIIAFVQLISWVFWRIASFVTVFFSIYN